MIWIICGIYLCICYNHKREQNGKKAPATYQSFLKLQRTVGHPNKPFLFPQDSFFPQVTDIPDSKEYSVPTLTQIGYPGCA